MGGSIAGGIEIAAIAGGLVEVDEIPPGGVDGGVVKRLIAHGLGAVLIYVHLGIAECCTFCAAQPFVIAGKPIGIQSLNP